MRQKEITFIPIKLLSLEDSIWTIYFYWSILKKLEWEKEKSIWVVFILVNSLQ